MGGQWLRIESIYAWNKMIMLMQVKLSFVFKGIKSDDE